MAAATTRIEEFSCYKEAEMRNPSEKKPVENNGSRRADRVPDQGGKRSQDAEKARKENESKPQPPESETIKQKH
mgnify:CR=1 FL=1